MEEWRIIEVIVVIIGLFFTVGKPILNYSKTVTEILSELKNHDLAISHNAAQIEEHETKLNDHEIRIHDLETEE